MHLPGIYIDRIVHNQTPEKGIKQRAVRTAYGLDPRLDDAARCAEDGLELVELVPGVDEGELEARTGAPFRYAH